MTQPKVITISGEPGTGTTTIANHLSVHTGYKLVYIGETFRELAREKGLTLPDLGDYAENHPEVDFELDARQVEQARGGNVILEGRLSGWLLKTNQVPAFKVLLTADLDTRVKRIVGREGKDYEQVKAEVLEREECEQERYKKYYNTKYNDKSHYDLIIDTSNLTPEDITQRILSEYSEFEG
jgi:predicted cytidylate kinase